MITAAAPLFVLPCISAAKCGYSAKAGKRTAVLGVNDFRNEVGFVYLALNHGDGQGN